MERSSDFLVLFASAMMAQRLPRTTTSRPTRGSAADLGVRPTRQPNPHHFQVVHPIRRDPTALTNPAGRQGRKTNPGSRSRKPGTDGTASEVRAKGSGKPLPSPPSPGGHRRRRAVFHEVSRAEGPFIQAGITELLWSPVRNASQAPEGTSSLERSSVRIRSEERRVGKECRSRWSP